MEVVNTGVKQIHITEKNIEQYLGIRRYQPEKLPDQELVGVVNGLAWTSVGGEILEVEVNVVPGTGKVELTGNLGDVMKESARAALSYIRSRAAQLGIEPGFYKDRDIHVHFPEGAVPKDGPSAGIAITTAIVSALTGTPVRRGVAMTGGDYPPGPCAAHRRAEGKDHGGSAQRDPYGDSPGGQSEGFGGD